MISDLIHDAAGTANDDALDPAKKKIDALKALLVGPERAAIDVEKQKAQFVRGMNLASPTGGALRVPVAATDATKPNGAKASRADVGQPIEFIHFGRVHHDVARTFESAAMVIDDWPLSAADSPGRAVYFRAAVEREAIVLAAFAKSVASALAEKEQKEGSLGDLMKDAGDVLGGAPGTEASAASADMKPFQTKIEAAWKGINQFQLAYADLHKAGIDLHGVRANLAAYLFDQLDKKGSSAAPAKPIASQMLSQIPLVGDMQLPGPVGEIVGMFRKVGGKLHDVCDSLIFGLTLAMQPAIEGACHDISLAAVQNRGQFIYPVWFAMPDAAQDLKGHSKNISHMDVDDPAGGDLKKIKALRDVDKGVHSFFGDVNHDINDAAKTPTEIVDFLSKEIKPAPGHKYLDAAFQAATGQSGALGGSEKLGEIAVTAFYAAVADDVPAFMHGFVETFVEYVFAVCVEFLRSVYRILCSMAPDETVSTDEMVAAGSAHILTHLVDFATSKLGLDELIQAHSIKVPTRPSYLPQGIDWPADGTKLSAAPIAATLKQMLLDKAEPYLKPVVAYAMSGLAARLNAQRGWAAPTAMTMEAHLGALPSELALLFRDLMKPLWSFIDDTCMSVVSREIAKGLGPAAKAIGLASGTLGAASGLIGDVQRKATALEKFAKNIEDRAKDLIGKLSSVTVGIGQTKDISDIESAAKALKDAATANPFAGSGANGGGGGGQNGNGSQPSGFPSNRLSLCLAKKITDADLTSEATNDKWKGAVDPAATAKSKAANGGAKQ